MAKSFYLTTTLPYVNADPHIGFALELVQADVVARSRALRGETIFFNTGTDEHGLKIYRAAEAAGVTPQAYVDDYAARFSVLPGALGVWPQFNFIRTTDEHHCRAAQEFWRRCDAAGDIYKKSYQVKYCVGCELEKTESELVAGRCPIHPNQQLELIEEENYFFRFSKYQDQLLKLYADRPDLVVPASRLNEIKTFVAAGLEDFSISRLASKMPWGIPVPGDHAQVMYVWFDALVNYISAVGWPDNEAKFNKWWPVTQFAGKDNLRQQAAMWQAMLMSAGLPPSKQIMIHGFIISGGQKMSKSLGNVINPIELAEEYGADAVRYYLIRHVHPFEDADFTLERFKEAYNAGLANGLGNLVSRVMKLVQDYQVDQPVAREEVNPDIGALIDQFEFNQAMDLIWEMIKHLDHKIAEEKPFQVVKVDEALGKKMILECKQKVADIGHGLAAFLPATSEIILSAVSTNQKPENLFPRHD